MADDREELLALRRLAELETKAGDTQPQPRPAAQPKMQLSDYPEYFGGAATGVASILPGIPGNIEALIRGVSGGNPKNVMPTSSDVQNWMAGANPSFYARLGRQAGELLPLTGPRKVPAPATATLPFASHTPEARANEILARTLARDRMTLENAQQALQQFGDKPLTIADVAGNATGRKARLVNTLEGDGSDQMSTFLSDRQAGQHTRVQDDIAANLAGGGDIYSMGKRMMAERDAAASPLYREAFQANQNVASPKLDRILETPAGKQALASARTKMQNDMTLMGVPDAELKDQALEAMMTGLPRQGVASGLKLRTFDYVKQALDDQISAKVKAGERGDVRILSGLKNELVRELDNLDVTARAGPNSAKAAGGAYARARAAYSGPTQSTEALENGGDFLKMSTGEIADTLKGMGEADQQFFRIGAAQKLRDAVDAAKDNADAARRIFGDKATRDRITAVFGRDAADRMAQSMSAERMMTATNQTVRGNSTTMNKAAEIAEGGGMGATIAQDAAKGFIAGGVRGAITLPLMNQAQGAIGAFFNRMPPDVRSALAQRLTATGPQAQNVLSDLITQANTVQNARIAPGGGASVAGIDPRYIAMMSPQLLAALLAPSGQTAP